MKKLIATLRNYAEDIFITTGLVFVSYATFLWSLTAGWYCVGVSFLLIGFFIARHPPGRR